MELLPGLISQVSAAPDATSSGFLPYARGSLMLDFVFVAMFGILLVLAVSIYLVKYRQAYELHKKLQIVSALVLLTAVTAFEIDLRVYTDWEALARPSAYWNFHGYNLVWISLAIHLCFAIPTPFVWGLVLYQALRRFPHPARPSPHSARHRMWGWIAAAGLCLTSVTGWIFYVLAFVC